MKKRSIGAALVLGFALTMMTVPGVSAQTRAERRAELQQQHQENVEQFQERKAEVKENIEENVEKRCSLATSRIELWTTRYANNQSRFEKTAEKSKQVTDQVVARAKAAGKDTAVLESAVQTFQGKVNTASAEYDELMSSLNNTKQYACGQSEGAFRDALQVSRQQLVTTRQAVLDARVYYQQSVRPAAAALFTK